MSASAVRLLCCGEVQTAARRFRDAGLEVVLLEGGVTPEELVAAAVAEDVGLVAVSDPELGAAALAALDEDLVVFWVTSDSGPSSPAGARD
jgi:hypothetical protein